MQTKMIAQRNDTTQNSFTILLAEKCRHVIAALGRIIAVTQSFRKVQAGADSALRVEEKLSLGPKKMLYLVCCREKEYLVAASTDTIVSIIEVSSEKPKQALRSAKPRLQNCEPVL